MTRPYLVGLIGAGVTPSLTPALHMQEAAALGLPYTYRTIDLSELSIAPSRIGELIGAARTLGYDALNVTHPCKQLVMEHLDAIDPTAARVGAVNTVVFENGEAIGYNTDTTGFARALAASLPHASTRRVVLLGAGGAGAAVSDALLNHGVGHLTVVDVDADRREGLCDSLTARFPGATIEAASLDKLPTQLPEADGLVNCTPVGMAEHPGLPVNPSLLERHLWVADIVYRPLETALLSAARDAGCRTLHGGHMAVHQAVDAFRLITGIEPNAARMLAQLLSLATPRRDASRDVGGPVAVHRGPSEQQG